MNEYQNTLNKLQYSIDCRLALGEISKKNAKCHYKCINKIQELVDKFTALDNLGLMLIIDGDVVSLRQKFTIEGE